MKAVVRYFVMPLLLGSMPILVQAGESDNQKFTVELQSLNGSGVFGVAEIEIEKENTLPAYRLLVVS